MGFGVWCRLLFGILLAWVGVAVSCFEIVGLLGCFETWVFVALGFMLVVCLVLDCGVVLLLVLLSVIYLSIEFIFSCV